MISKKKIISTVAAVILILTPISAVPAFAANSTTTQSNFFTGLIQFLAQKFGLDQSKVASAVTEYKNQHKTQMQQNMQNREKTRLDSLVQQGKITSSQEQAIVNELAKIRSEFDPSKLTGMTPQQRRQQFQNQQNELRSWAQSQGINMSYILPMGMRMRGRYWHRMDNVTPTPTT